MTVVSRKELEMTVDWVSSDIMMNEAFISLESGKIYWVRDDSGVEDEEAPEDVEDPDRYLQVPTKQDLDLGQAIVFEFVRRALPDHEGLVRGYFRRRGAYGRLKDLLEREGKLQQWYDYEAEQEDRALEESCKDHRLELGP